MARQVVPIYAYHTVLALFVYLDESRIDGVGVWRIHKHGCFQWLAVIVRCNNRFGLSFHYANYGTDTKPLCLGESY